MVTRTSTPNFGLPHGVPLGMNPVSLNHGAWELKQGIPRPLLEVVVVGTHMVGFQAIEDRNLAGGDTDDLFF